MIIAQQGSWRALCGLPANKPEGRALTFLGRGSNQDFLPGDTAMCFSIRTLYKSEDLCEYRVAEMIRSGNRFWWGGREPGLRSPSSGEGWDSRLQRELHRPWVHPQTGAAPPLRAGPIPTGRVFHLLRGPCVHFPTLAHGCFQGSRVCLSIQAVIWLTCCVCMCVCVNLKGAELSPKCPIFWASLVAQR